MGWVQGSSILLLVVIATGANSGCPSGCTCTAGTKPSARCTSSNLQGPFPPETKIIDAHGSRISSISSGIFNGLDIIDEIILNDNQLTSITSGTFSGGQNVMTLNLADNRITSLGANAFSVLKRLSDLNLSNNRIGNLPSGIFNRNKLLRDLNLHNCGLRSLALDVFPSLIRNIDLSSNSGLQLPLGSKGETLFTGSRVRVINLDNSGVTTDVHYFQGAVRVNTISLVGNTVTGTAPNNRIDNMCLDGSCYDSCGGGAFESLNKPMSKLKQSATPDLHGLLFDLSRVTELYTGTKTRIAIYADVAYALGDLAVDTGYPVQVIVRSFYIGVGKRVKAGGSVQACKFKYVISRAGQRKLIFAKFGPLLVLTDNMYYDGPCAFDTSIRHTGVVPTPNVLKAVIRCAEMNRADATKLETMSIPMLNSVISLASASGTSSSKSLRLTLDEAKKKQVDIDIEIRSGSRIVPYLSLTAYTEILTNLRNYGHSYEEQYENLFASTQRLELQQQTFGALTTQASNLQGVAQEDLDQGEQALAVSTEVLNRYKSSFVDAKADLRRNKEAFEVGVEKYKAEQAVKAALAFVKAIFGIVFGAVTKDPAAIFDGIMDLIEAMMGLIDLIEQITALMSSLDKMTETLGKARSPDTDVTIYLNDIDKAAGLRVKIAEWENMRILAGTQLDTNTVREIDGAANFRESVYKVANYGEAMTAQLITQSRLVNEAYTNQLNLELSKEYLSQIETDFKGLASKAIEQNAVLWQIKMQRFQAQMLLTQHMLQYCRIYYYFMLSLCPSNEMPQIGDSMTSLIQKIDMVKAKQLINMVRMRNSGSMNELVTLRDKSGICQEDHDCPVARLKENARIFLNITRANDDDFNQYMRVRVDEIKVLLKGAVNPTSGTIKLRVSNTGDFKDYFNDKDFNFLSIPFDRVFKYVPSSGGSSIASVRLQANDVNQKLFMSTTPFTIWVIEFVPEENKGIDLSGLTEVQISFIGNVIHAKPPTSIPQYRPPYNKYGPYGRRRRRKRSILKYKIRSF